jgi:hypothetical protein
MTPVDSLLIFAVAEQSQELYRRYTESPPNGRTAASRVHKLITELTETMTANRTLTVALLRAPAGPNARDRDAAEMLECIWFSSLIGWATGADDEAHIHDVMQRAARTLLGTRP